MRYTILSQEFPNANSKIKAEKTKQKQHQTNEHRLNHFSKIASC
jgi:hypothetical protein